MLGILGSTWGSVARLRAALYERGWLSQRRLEKPVISVGALSVGGAGKTPTTALLATLLAQAGLRPAILSRGYRRSGKEPLLVSSGDGRGPLVSAGRAGDEPFWLASVLPGVAVAVAARREEAAALAAAAGPVDVFLLDDGFQHLRVARDVDLLVVNPEAPFWSDRPLPSGRLREPATAAGRADAFLLVGDDRGAAEALGRRFVGTAQFELRRQPARCWRLAEAVPEAMPMPTSADPDLGGCAGQPVFAFAGIARPQRFYDDLEDAGVTVCGRHTFADHHAYSTADLDAVATAAARAGAALLVTTEKDAVRLPDSLLEIPVHVWGYRLATRDPERLVSWLMDRAGLSRETEAA